MTNTLGHIASNSDLTSVYSWLSFAQPFSHWLGNHPVQKVISLLHLVVQHLHTLLQLAGLLLLLHSKWVISQNNTVSLHFLHFRSSGTLADLGLLD